METKWKETLLRLSFIAFMTLWIIVPSAIISAENLPLPSIFKSETEGISTAYASPALLANLFKEDCTCPLFTGEDDCLFEADCPSVLERVKEWKMEVLPNPVIGDFPVVVKGGDDPSRLRLQIADMNGVVIRSDQQLGSRKLELEGNKLPPGDYIARLLLNDMVIQRVHFLKIR